MEWLCWLFGALLVVTLVGHGIWVVLALIFRPRRAKSHAAIGAPIDRESRSLESELEALIRAGLIDTDTRDRVALAMIQLRQRRVPPPIPVLPLPAAPIQPTTVVDKSPIAATPPDSLIVVAAPPAPASPPPPPVVVVKPPRRSFSEVFAAFLHESNIRWGELMGGLLIVGCSIALVLSFWNQIAAKPLFQFGLFTSVTAAAFALGLYAEHRWKLPTTSRGILLIATLLVPLNFLAFAALSHGRPVSALISVCEAGALAALGYLAWRAARVLSPCWPGLLTAGVVGLSGSLMLTPHLPRGDRLTGLLLSASIPAAVYLALTGIMLRRANRWKVIRQAAVDAIFLLLGVLSFAAAVAVGLVIFSAPQRWLAAQQLAPLLSGALIPSLWTGVLLWQRIKDSRLGRPRTVGTAIAVASAFLMLGGIALAWPDPAGMLPLAIIDFLALALVAELFDLPAGHVPAVSCLTVAYVLAYQVARGWLGWHATSEELLRASSSPHLGIALVPLAAITTAIALACFHRARRQTAKIYAWSTAALAAVSVALVTQHGFSRGADFHAQCVYLAYGLLGIALAWWAKRPAAGWAGCLLLLGAVVQFFVPVHSASPFGDGMLLYAILGVAAGVMLKRHPAQSTSVRRPAQWTAAAASAMAAILFMASASYATCPTLSVRILCLSALWLWLAITEDSFAFFTASQIAMAVATVLAIVGQMARRSWFLQSPEPLIQPLTVQAVTIGLALLGLAFSVLRQLLPVPLPVARWLKFRWTFDRVLACELLGGLLTLSITGVAPAVMREFATRSSSTGGWAVAAYATGAGTWGLLTILVTTFALWAWQRRENYPILLLVATVACACPMISATFETSAAGASALRWSLAAFLLVFSIPVWLRGRESVVPGTFPARANLASDVRMLLFAIAAVPVLGLSIYPALRALQDFQIAGPIHGCFFSRIGASAAYAVPLLIVAAAFIGNAIRERSAAWAAAGAAVCNLTVTLALLLEITSAGQTFSLVYGVRLIQLNVIVLAGFAAGWELLRRIEWRHFETSDRRPALLKAQVSLAVAGNALLLAPAAALLFAVSWREAALLAAVGDLVGCVALAVALGAVWLCLPKAGWLRTSRISLGLIALSILCGCAATKPGAGAWLGFHVWMVASLASTVLLACGGVFLGRARRGWAEPVPALATAPQTPSHPVTLQYERTGPAGDGPASATVYVGGQELVPSILRWTGILSGVAVLLALRAMAGDPQAPAWSVALTGTLSLLWIGIACWISAPRLLYAAGLLLNLAATMASLHGAWPGVWGRNIAAINIFVLSLGGLAALVLHLKFFNTRAKQNDGLPFHRFAAMVSTACLSALAITSLSARLTGMPVLGFGPVDAAALAATVLLAAASLWDEQSRFAVPQLYLLGPIALAILLSRFNRSVQWFEVAGTVAIAGYVLLTSILFAATDRLRGIALRIGIPLPPGETRDVSWLVPVNFSVAVAAIGLAAVCDFGPEPMQWRLTAATMAVLQVVGLLLASGRTTRPGNCAVALSLGAAAAVVWSWSWMPAASRGFLNVSVVTILSLTLVAFILAAARLRIRDESWRDAVRTAFVVVASAWGLILLGVMSAQVSHRVLTASAKIHPLAGAALVGTLIFTSAFSLMNALIPRFDPLEVKGRRREGYVYLSEALLGLAILQLRLTAPWMFGGLLAPYWPLIVMGLAFAGVGAAEWLRRRGLMVLASPLALTGIFLPLLPVLAFWAGPSKVDFSNLLFVVGAFYALQSATRRSFGFGVIAALAANAGLWVLLAHRPPFAFLVHPQLWLIPAAVSVLIAAQLNADRLPAERLRFVRYCCLMLVYVSSTADIFLNGVAEHPWLPMVLAALSIAGVMIGLALRIRPFLFLGCAFLTMAVVTMIYDASTNLHWTWLWYVAGIGLGASIIGLFALFEKKREEMLALVEGLKRWE